MSDDASDEPRIAIALIRQLDACADLVFAACTDPRRLVQWLTPGAGEVRAARCELRVGGAFSLEGCNPDGRAYAVSGAFLEILPGRRVAMTWHYAGDGPLAGPASRVQIDLRPLGPDVTELTLSHTRLDRQETADRYGAAWAICLERLRWSTTPQPDAAVFTPPLGAISNLYGPRHRVFQEEFETRDLANRLRTLSVTSELSARQQAFIARQDLAFVTSIDHRGFPTCSYKGGARGFVRVVSPRQLELPSYDGNGMYLTAGNLAANPKLGLLFVDFETPHRLRLHGTAQMSRDAEILARHPGAELVIRIGIAEVFVNCPRYIHRYERQSTSGFVPGQERAGELPAWKRIDVFGDVLPDRDRLAIDARQAEALTLDDYRALLERGET
ncbi:SRPBCC domain-containing protein [Methylobacterium sp. A49B]